MTWHLYDRASALADVSHVECICKGHPGTSGLRPVRSLSAEGYQCFGGFSLP